MNDWRRAVHDLRQPLAAAEMYTHLLAGRLDALGLAEQDPARAHAQVVAEQLRLLALALDRLSDAAQGAAAEGDDTAPAPGR